MARCPRCRRPWPYFRSRASKRPGKGRTQRFARGKDCPLCGKRTERMRVPRKLRIFRLLFGSRFTYRDCAWCGWQGGAFHAPADAATGDGRGRPRERVRKRRSRKEGADTPAAGEPAAPPPPPGAGE